MEYSFGTLDNTIWQGCTGGCIVMVFDPIRTGQGRQGIYHYMEDTLVIDFQTRFAPEALFYDGQRDV